LDFVRRLAWDRSLTRDLQTDRMEALHASAVRQLSPQIVTFATCVPERAMTTEGVPRASDQFFQRLRELTGRRAPGSAVTAAAIELLKRNAHSAIRNPSAHLTVFDAGSNDGVVNTSRQILIPSPNDAAEPHFGGCVLGDHADVIGHYDRQDPLSFGLRGQQRPINNGFFRSGAGFGDDQFFSLYGRVADWVARAARADQLESARPEPLALAANQ
jgi:hypothetical protein